MSVDPELLAEARIRELLARSVPLHPARCHYQDNVRLPVRECVRSCTADSEAQVAQSEIHRLTALYPAAARRARVRPDPRASWGSP